MDKGNVNLGPLATEELHQTLRNQIKNSVQYGAQLSYGSLEVPDKFKRLNGNFIQPLILENVSTNSRAFKEEIFGPVFSLFRVKTDQEAIDLANQSEFGLTSTVFSGNEERAKSISKLINCQHRAINDYSESFFNMPDLSGDAARI